MYLINIKDIEKWDPSVRKSNISVKQLFIVLSTGTDAGPQPWLAVIDVFIDDSVLQLWRENKAIKLFNY